MSFPRYESYKDSGVEWLGELPEHWEIKKIRRVISAPLINGIFKKKREFGKGVLLVNVFDIYHARSTNRGVSWSATTQPIVATTFDARLPDLFVDGNTIHVVWEEQDVGTFPTYSADVFYSVSTNGGSSWSTPEKISDPDDDNDPSDGDPEDGVAPHIYVVDGRIHVLFTEQKGDAGDNNQFVHHISCLLSKNCTVATNWKADDSSEGSISGQRLGANNNSPYSVLSTIGYMQDCVFAFYHGTIGGVATANELLFGSSSCNNGPWSNRVELTTDNVQALRPDVATQDDRWMYVVYEQVSGSNRQIRFLRNNPEYLLYLPLITKP